MLKGIVKSLCGLSLLAVAATCYAERVPNEYASWKSCKVGTSVRVERKDTHHPDMVERTTSKLVAIHGDELTIEDVADGAISMTLKRRISPPGSFYGPDIKRPAPTTRPAEEGDDELKVAGTMVKAHWVKTTHGELVTTLWTSDEVPGGFCLEKRVEDDGKNHRERTSTVVEIVRP